MSSGIEAFNTVQFSVLNWTLSALAFFVTAFRIGVRIRRSKRLLPEDYFALISMLFMLAMAISNELQRDGIYVLINVFADMAAGLPFTYPTEEIDTKHIYQLKVQFAFFFFFWITLWAAKASVLTFYRRLFVGVDGYMTWYWAVVAINFIAFLGSILTNFLCCTPIYLRWSVDTILDCPQSNLRNAIFVATAFDILTDILIMILPIRLIFGIQIPTRQKVILAGIFGLGFIIVLFALIRMQKVSAAILDLGPDGYVSLSLWSILEVFVAIVVTNLPVLKSLMLQTGDSSYAVGTKDNGTNNINMERSRIGNETHIRLYDMMGDTSAEIHAVYGSSDALHPITANGIVKTQEVTIVRDHVFEDKSQQLNDEASTKSLVS